MPWADLSEGFSGLKQWSEPVIYDRLIAAYRKLISDHELSRNLTQLHARVWRALIRGDMAEFDLSSTPQIANTLTSNANRR